MGEGEVLAREMLQPEKQSATTNIGEVCHRFLLEATLADATWVSEETSLSPAAMPIAVGDAATVREKLHPAATTNNRAATVEHGDGIDAWRSCNHDTRSWKRRLKKLQPVACCEPVMRPFNGEKLQSGFMKLQPMNPGAAIGDLEGGVWSYKGGLLRARRRGVMASLRREPASAEAGAVSAGARQGGDASARWR